ncbi:helix-turn-helix domain-containing protein [Phytoactinopolyspora limicola]|uniref:AraC-like ligand-binding domain-containing protein n=1 Tax=Phytoactinopolyspora limicola TaxID=2715536 RepID=UPI0014087C6B|nr:helix-turn-helix domain-containing protein [Phytoactinopolyspora limicola]
MNSANLRTGPITTTVVRDFRDFRNLVSASFVPLNVTSRAPDTFWGRVRSGGIGAMQVFEINAAEHVVERTPELIERADRRQYKVSLILSGSGLLVQDNRQAVLRPGQLAIYDTSRPYTLVFEEDFRSMVLMFPQNQIALPVEMVGQLTATPIPGDRGVAKVVVPFLTQLNAGLDQLHGAMGTRLAHSALDLVTTMFASELDLERTATDPHHALMQQIRSYIDDNLAATDLGPSRIAAEHFISTRHLHGLFREQGTTVSSWIRERRLERCRRDLLDPVHAQRPVAAVAAKWGFVDAAHFSRVFKATFGQSPSELRNSAGH